MSGRVTRREDIYSYGVLLMEIVTGRRHTNMLLPADEQYIPEMMWTFYKRRELATLIDTSLDGQFGEEQACRFLKIGLLCKQNNTDLRPVMPNVVAMLTGEKNVDDMKIKKPIIFSGNMGSKKRNNPQPKPLVNDAKTYYSSGVDALNNTSFTSEPSTHDPTFTYAPSLHATMSFTSTYDRSI